jgi:uncharacterized lipoprotein YbaY
MATTATVSGKIVFERNIPAEMGLTLHVFLEDVSLMDMPAKQIAKYTAHDVVVKSDGIPFKLSGDMPHANHRYEVRAHLSRDGSTDFKKGDFLSTESHPVDPQHIPAQLTIKVHQI